MQIQQYKLNDHLKSGPPASCWLVSGDETFLVEESLKEIRLAAKQAGITERKTIHTEARFDWRPVLSEAQSLSLFSDQRLLEVRTHKGNLDKSASAAMLEIIAGTGDGLTLVLLMPKLESRVTQSKWYKALTKNGVHVPVWPVAIKDMPGWLAKRARSAGVQLTDDGLAALQYRLVGNLLAADQEINKLKLFGEDTLWDAEQINQMMGDSSRFTVFDLLDASLAGQRRMALKMLRRLALEGEEPLKLLALIRREILNLRAMRTAVNEGSRTEQVMKQHRVFGQRTAATAAALGRINLEQCDGLLARLTWVDQGVKGALLNDVWEMLENIIVTLSGTRRLAPLSMADERLLPHPDFSD